MAFLLEFVWSIKFKLPQLLQDAAGRQNDKSDFQLLRHSGKHGIWLMDAAVQQARPGAGVVRDCGEINTF